MEEKEKIGDEGVKRHPITRVTFIDEIGYNRTVEYYETEDLRSWRDDPSNWIGKGEADMKSDRVRMHREKEIVPAIMDSPSIDDVIDQLLKERSADLGERGHLLELELFKEVYHRLNVGRTRNRLKAASPKEIKLRLSKRMVDLLGPKPRNRPTETKEGTVEEMRKKMETKI